MIVNKYNFNEALEEILSAEVIALDTETTGLLPYHGDKVFSLIITTKHKSYYFNFNDKPDHLGEIAPKDYTFTYQDVAVILENLPRYDYVYIHNAKFDMHAIFKSMGYYDSLINSKIFCTQAMARLVRNDLNSYSLANLGALIGHKKDDTVEKYIDAHKLYTLVDNGKKQKEKLKHFDLVPFEIISAYGLRDGEVCFKLGEYIRKRLYEINEEQTGLGLKSNEELIKNEMALTIALFEAESKGVKVDPSYCLEALKYENYLIEEAKKEFLELTAIEFQDAPTVLKEAYTKLGLKYGTTEKGNASFSDDNLPDNHLSDIIRKYRKSYKRANTYYKNFLKLKDYNNLIHCNFNQAGTSTGRLSSNNPNLQNVPKRNEDENKYPVRRAFIPEKGYIFALLDYQAQEYRLLLDLANEKEVIRQILEEGLDVHTATANTMKVTRTEAKTLNFMLLYGGGTDKLADSLKIVTQKAKELKAQYFEKLGNVKNLIRGLIDTAKNRGFVVNWYGRKINNRNSEDAYKIPNHYIQGGCGDIAKIAIVNIYRYLKGKKSYLSLSIHDEIVISLHESEYFILNDIKKIMVDAYPFVNLPMDTGLDLGKNLYDKHEYKNI